MIKLRKTRRDAGPLLILQGNVVLPLLGELCGECNQLAAGTIDPFQLPQSCHVRSQRESLLADDCILPSLQNFSISMFIGQLVALLYHVYILVFSAVLLGCLKTVSARAVLIDFTKACDIVNHTVLMSKLAELQLLGNIRI